MESILNRHARHDYEILDSFEAGLVLAGHEVKSVKEGRMHLKGAFVTVKHVPKPELYLTNATISKYSKAGPLPGYDETRPRKLLVHKAEIKRLIGKLETNGLTLIPLKVYTVRHRLKLEVGLGKGKKMFEKKESKKIRGIERDIHRTLKTQRIE